MVLLVGTSDVADAWRISAWAVQILQLVPGERWMAPDRVGGAAPEGAYDAQLCCSAACRQSPASPPAATSHRGQSDLATARRLDHHRRSGLDNHAQPAHARSVRTEVAATPTVIPAPAPSLTGHVARRAGAQSQSHPYLFHSTGSAPPSSHLQEMCPGTAHSVSRVAIEWHFSARCSPDT